MIRNADELPFRDRIDAGRALARRLIAWFGRSDLLVLALPRGGVPVAVEVAALLHAPLDVWLVQRIGVPGQEDYALGAMASGGCVRLDPEIVREAGLSDTEVADVVRRHRVELDRREHEYRRGRPLPRIRGRTVILVDDGLATGATMRAAVASLREHGPAEIVAAVPVASRLACAEVARAVDTCISVAMPEPFRSVGQWYADFALPSDEDVAVCLERFGESGLHAIPRTRRRNAAEG